MNRDNAPQGGFTAVVQVPAYQESDRLEATLDAIAAEPVPEGWGVDYEAWVTPTTPDASSDPTYRVADEHPVFDVHEAPPGKLATRNAAHAAAVERGYDVFVTWDADTLPGAEDPLSAMLEPFSDPTVSAVNSRPHVPPSLVMPVYHAVMATVRKVYPYMHGQASAIRSTVWERVGPFDTSIDQTDLRQVWAEEEVGLLRRLKQHGRVPKPREAVVISSARRVGCRVEDITGKLGRERSPFCQRRGDTTFAPRERGARRYR